MLEIILGIYLIFALAFIGVVLVNVISTWSMIEYKKNKRK